MTSDGIEAPVYLKLKLRLQFMLKKFTLISDKVLLKDGITYKTGIHVKNYGLFGEPPFSS